MFWEVDINSVKVYLLGSIHYGREDFYPLPDPIEKAFEESKTIAFELDNFADLGTPASSFEMLTNVFTVGSYKDGTTIDQHLDEETLEKLKVKIENCGLPFSLFKNLQPGLLSMLLASFKLDKAASTKKENAAELGVDFYLSKKAKKSKKDIYGLETVESQLRIFCDIPLDEQYSLLKNFLNDDREKKHKEDIDEMLNHWKEGDLECLKSTLPKEDEVSDFSLSFLDKRNQNIVEEIIKIAKTKETPIMAVVGALHMVGDEGIPTLLQSKGYNVKRIQYSF